jgi:hypothetical protein
MSSNALSCIADPLGAVTTLFDAATAAAEPDVDGDWGVRAVFEEALALPGVLESVRCAPGPFQA